LILAGSSLKLAYYNVCFNKFLSQLRIIIIKHNPAQRYLRTLESEQSRTAVTSLLNNVARCFDPEKTLLEVDWSLLSADFIYTLRDRMRHRNRSPSTINAYLAALKGVAKQCWQMHLIDVQTYQEIKEIKRSKGSRVAKGRALSIEELNAMLDYCMTEDGPIALRDATLIALVYGAGLRRHEAVRLELNDYSPNKTQIRVVGKGNKERVNALNNRVIDIIECWLDERGRHPGPLFNRIRRGGNITEQPISPQTVYDIIIRRYKEAGLERLTPHDLRRTYATNLLETGTDIFIVQELMGHAHLNTTKRYDKRGDKEKTIAGKALPL